jgi:hypothetical protein
MGNVHTTKSSTLLLLLSTKLVSMKMQSKWMAMAATPKFSWKFANWLILRKNKETDNVGYAIFLTE